mmetsp:Transcript_11801/g.15322  ORF Transcript_11801/g.15322 Transcript_11801/m.15322 type:complete len:428 (+) Transcript_11801:133-1416(+)
MPAFEALRGLRKSVRKRQRLKAEKEWEESQKSRHPCFRTKVPLRILKNAWLYKLVYICLIGIVFFLVKSVPKTLAVDSDGNMHQFVKKDMKLMLSFTLLMFFLLQASDPGYVEVDDEEVDEEDNLLSENSNRNTGTKRERGRGRSGRRRNTGPVSNEGDRLGMEEEIDNKGRSGDIEMSRPRKSYATTLNRDYLEVKGHESDSNDEDTTDSEYDLFSDDDFEVDLEPDEGLDSRLSGVDISRVPLRTKYCRQSQKFVAKYDHFCGVIGTCIGERNHFRFWLFLLGNTIMICYGVVVVHSGFRDTTAKFEVWIGENGHALAVMIVLVFLLLVVGGLFCFHCFLLIGNVTSYEFMRTEKISYLAGTKDFDLPFSRGLCTNLTSCIVQDGLIAMLLRREWKPFTYKREPIVRDSDNIFDNLWENKYWSCC